MNPGSLIMEMRVLGYFGILVKEGDMFGTSKKRHCHLVLGKALALKL